MTSHPRNLVSALALLALALLPAAATAQIINPGCDGQCPQRPPIIEIPPPRVNSNQIAPQIKAIQDLTDPVLISIIPGEVVNRDAHAGKCAQEALDRTMSRRVEREGPARLE